MGAEIDGMNDLIASLEAAEEALDGNPTAKIGTNVEYAPYVEYGRGPVTPDDAQALRWESDGEVVFAMHADPVPPQPFMRPAARRTADDIPSIAEDSERLEEIVIRAAARCETYAKGRVPVDTGNLRASIGWELI